MKITFNKLSKHHLNLMLKWLNKCHVKKWWDPEISYTYEIVLAKYNSYISGYKVVDGIKKPIYAHIVFYGDIPVAYIQSYNAYNFNKILETDLLYSSEIGMLDFFIGEEEYLKKGIGTAILINYISNFCKNYYSLIVDINKNNVASLKTFARIGFIKLDRFVLERPGQW